MLPLSINVIDYDIVKNFDFYTSKYFKKHFALEYEIKNICC